MDFIGFYDAFALCYRAMRSTYLIVAHGSKEKESFTAFQKLLKAVRTRLKGKMVEGAFLQINSPSISEAIDRCAKRGERDIVILPMMMFPGRHVKEHIPEIIENAKAKHPQMDFHYARPLSDYPAMLTLIKEQTGVRHPKRKAKR